MIIIARRAACSELLGKALFLSPPSLHRPFGVNTDEEQIPHLRLDFIGRPEWRRYSVELEG